ncbi:tRNA-specific adenosine deaminase [Halobacteriales archaeon SW_7_71_33]|nr:MAG: tRNA-specific adenosine deaminase [Halobacteriales archaeon SW_7_71_33]
MADVEPREAMARALDLAEAAAAAGDEPFGSVLVYGESVIEEERNTVATDDDHTAHPELKLVRWAGRNLSPEERRRTTMYTSTEPCPMCAGGIYNVGLGRVVYSASAEVLSIVAGGEPGPRCAEIVDDRTDVEGPVLPERGRDVHEAFW